MADERVEYVEIEDSESEDAKGGVGEISPDYFTANSDGQEVCCLETDPMGDEDSDNVRNDFLFLETKIFFKEGAEPLMRSKHIDLKPKPNPTPTSPLMRGKKKKNHPKSSSRKPKKPIKPSPVRPKPPKGQNPEERPVLETDRLASIRREVREGKARQELEKQESLERARVTLEKQEKSKREKLRKAAMGRGKKSTGMGRLKKLTSERKYDSSTERNLKDLPREEQSQSKIAEFVVGAPND